jgi:hypothetical protein
MCAHIFYLSRDNASLWWTWYTDRERNSIERINHYGALNNIMIIVETIIIKSDNRRMASELKQIVGHIIKEVD